MPSRYEILVVDDEKNAREGLKWALEGDEYSVALASDGDQALDHISAHPVDLIITDLKMPGIDGLELLKKAREHDPAVQVIMITAHSTVETAVEAMRQGAHDYQTKPIRIDEMKLVVERALKIQSMARENEQLHQAVEERYGFEQIIGSSPPMEDIFNIMRQVAPTTATVLIQGESGTGKELIANGIHYNSPRARHPLIAVNCGALSTTLLESELFGHEKGAFTGANKSRQGRFELADRGTIFLDEISETSAEFQVKLLRILQEHSLERVGGVETIKVDIRVIAATNQNLEQLVADGKFREDLYYRLNVINIKVPPLRDRAEDIPVLAGAFLKEFSEQYDKGELRFSPKTQAIFQSYPWPGNVRQLRNVIEGLVVMANTKEISPRQLPDQIREGSASKGQISLPVGSTLSELEREAVRATLAHFGGNRAQTARQLGIGRKTLYRKMDEYNIE